jgi:hypothetical protein
MQPLAARAQTVAVGNEPKLLLGAAAGAAVVFGVAMIAYGATSTCKGLHGENTGTCDKKVVIGALSLSAGATTFVVWALSRD